MPHVKVVRYCLRVSKDRPLPTFPEFLAQAIDARFDSDSAFARAAGVSPSAVSRWVKGELRPTPPMLERISRALGINVNTLSAIAYPELAAAPEMTYEPPAAQHPLVRELERLLAEDSPVPAGDRDTLHRVIDSVLQPYRRYLKGRRRAA
jgi:transcriptional regulator with XRE-family HTH domain